MFVEVGRIRVDGERAALGAIGRQQDDFALAAIDVGGEYSGDRAAGDGLAEDQVALGEVEADVFLIKGYVADAVALVAIEAILADGAGDFGRSAGIENAGQQEGQAEQATHHSLSLAPRGLDACGRNPKT